MLDFNSMKHQTGVEDPKVQLTKGIHQRSIGRGLEVLSDREIEIVVKSCSDIFKMLGYQLPKNQSTNRRFKRRILDHKYLQSFILKLKNRFQKSS